MNRMLAIALLAAAPLAAVNAQLLKSQTADFVDVPTRAVKSGGSAQVFRVDTVLKFNVNAVGLQPNHAYVLYLVVFNAPQYCAGAVCDYTVDSGAMGGNPLVDSTTVYLSGGVIDANGNAKFHATLDLGAAGLVGREVLEGTGVYAMVSSQLQIIIRDKGPWGSINKYRQTTEYAFGCDINTCEDAQIATFK